jgi:hypothetical protein
VMDRWVRVASGRTPRRDYSSNPWRLIPPRSGSG